MLFNRVRRWFMLGMTAMFLFGLASVLDNHGTQYIVRVPDSLVASNGNGSASTLSSVIINTDASPKNHSQDYIQLPTFYRDIMPSEKDNIFLLETGNASESTYLKYRVLCSLESWCSANPSHEVWLLVRSNQIWDADRVVHRLFQLCPNLRLASLDPDLILIQTPLYGLYISNLFSESLWPASHLSDLLRLGLLWKVGGMYTDTDTVCLRSVAGLTNVVGLGASNHVAPAIMHFDPYHPFLKRCMEILLNIYHPKYYITAVKAVEQETWHSCNVTVNKLDTLPFAQPNPCPGFKVLPPKAFYPINWVLRFETFRPGARKRYLKIFNDSYVFHIANGDTFNRSVILGTETVYEEAAQRFCPLTFKTLSTRSMFF
ncbi:unnamed protein product, partial [Meganyctiphanes norvegica]